MPHGKYNQFPISQGIRRVAGKYLFDYAGEGINVGRKCRLSNHIQIGDYSSIGDGSYVSSSLIIGNNVMIAPSCALLGLDHIFDENTLDNKGTESRPITIEDHVWIGYGVKILSGVTIGKYAIVDAGAVVTKDVKPYSIAVGVPARTIKFRRNTEVIN